MIAITSSHLGSLRIAIVNKQLPLHLGSLLIAIIKI